MSSAHWDIRISVYEPDEDKLDELFEIFTALVYDEFDFHRLEVFADIAGGTETDPVRLEAYSVSPPLITNSHKWKPAAEDFMKEKLHAVDPHCRIEIALKIPPGTPFEEL